MGALLSNLGIEQGRVPGGFTSKGLEPAMVVLSYVPAFYGIFLLASADDNDEYGDKKGMSGLFAGIVALAYSSVLGKQVLADTNGDFCKVAAALRAILGVIAFFAGVVIAVNGGEDSVIFILFYIAVAVFTLVESPLLYIYALTLQAPMAPPQPPPQPPPWPHPTPPQARAPHCHDFVLPAAAPPCHQYMVAQPSILQVPVTAGHQHMAGSQLQGSMGFSSMTPAMMVPRETVFFPGGPVELHSALGIAGQSQAQVVEVGISRPAESPMAVPLTGERPATTAAGVGPGGGGGGAYF